MNAGNMALQSIRSKQILRRPALICFAFNKTARLALHPAAAGRVRKRVVKSFCVLDCQICIGERNRDAGKTCGGEGCDEVGKVKPANVHLIFALTRPETTDRMRSSFP